MKYFITGATGFIGGRVLGQVLSAGGDVHALVRSPEKARALVRPGVTLFEGDITDKESMRAGMQGVDAVFHLAAWFKIGARDRSAAERINVGGTRNVLELMRELGVPKGVYTSTVAINSNTGGRIADERYRYDGPFLSEYERTKWLAHHEVALPLIAQGLPLVIVQPGLVYGPGDTSTMRAAFVEYLMGRLPVVPKGAAYSWVHVDDAARGHLLAMEKGRPGESYILAGPSATLAEVLALAQQITGIAAPRVHASQAVLRAMAAVMGVVEKAVPVPESYSSEAIRVGAGNTYLASSAKAEEELGYEVRPIEDGLRETLLYEMNFLGIQPKSA